MCGIIGMAGNITGNLENKAFRDMLDVCQVRGRDSTGVFKVTRDLNYNWVKNIGPPSNLCDLRVYQQAINPGMAKVLAGHCRSATVGGVKIANAHPFDIDDKLVGMHNGTLKNYYNLDGYHHELVDSEILMKHIAKHGAKETFSKVEGAWACVWYDAELKTLNFIRNSERPLFLIRNKKGDLLAWASEAWMFGALGRHEELDKPVLLQENNWLSYHLPKGNAELDKGHACDIHPKPEFVKVTQGFSNWRRDDSTHHVHTNGCDHSENNSTKTQVGQGSVTYFRDKKKEKKDKNKNRDPFQTCLTPGKQPEPSDFVDVRDVAGIPFITNKHTGREYSQQVFWKNTGGQCCFCELPFADLNAVAEMFSEEYAICKDCFGNVYEPGEAPKNAAQLN